MRIAILGGTFNPPHFGHLFFANEIRQKLKYDKIIFVPSLISAHKTMDNNVTSNNRCDMVELAIAHYPWAEISYCDIKRGGVTRTVDTINDIITEFNIKTKPGFIIGDDLVSGFHLWKNPEIITDISDLIVGIRNNDGFELDYPHILLNNRPFTLSSSEIRYMVNNNEYIDFLLPQNVINYIKDNGLYR
ncbi:MAG: nicotinate (nicotinamide) nucleotide adenylyltransferase [Spirochaetaceae bacterium 4572_7]|nr:MAG: nicotinate (nicotinamide) nucleotide adenylyltransferase [Spirochaetaceae bacterium 4572_7]